MGAAKVARRVSTAKRIPDGRLSELAVHSPSIAPRLQRNSALVCGHSRPDAAVQGAAGIRFPTEPGSRTWRRVTLARLAHRLRVVHRKELRRDSRPARTAFGSRSPMRLGARCRRQEAEAMTLSPERDWRYGGAGVRTAGRRMRCCSRRHPLRCRPRWPNQFHITSLGP